MKAEQVRSRILNLVSSKASGDGLTYTRLSDVGLTVGGGAHLQFDEKQFRDAFVADPLIVERSRAAAADLSTANGGGSVSGLVITAGARTIELAISVGGHRQRASIVTACCRP